MCCCSLRDHLSLECIFCPWDFLGSRLFLGLNDSVPFVQPPWGLWIATSPCWCHLGIKLCLGPIHWIKRFQYQGNQISLECVVWGPYWNYLFIRIPVVNASSLASLSFLLTHTTADACGEVELQMKILLCDAVLYLLIHDVELYALATGASSDQLIISSAYCPSLSFWSNPLPLWPFVEPSLVVHWSSGPQLDPTVCLRDL